jgi:EAL and modified HD-GYP domain-containing signal transduction protein
VLVARQPILDSELRPHGYELLCRATTGAAFPAGMDPGQATAAVIARSFLSLGLNTVTGGRPAYVNVDSAHVLRGDLAVLPPALVVLELGRDVDARDEATVAALADLRRCGYRLVVDQLASLDDARLGLLGAVDGAKLDFERSEPATRKRLAARLEAAGIDVFASKVETREQADEAFAIGCRYVQGYFFAEPLVLSRRQPPGFRPTHLRLLEAVRRDELDFSELESIIETDLLLSHQFLRYINVARFGWRRTITSLRHALVLLGEDRARQWVALVVMADLAEDKPQQLAVTACLRARFCELVGSAAPGLAERRFDLFLLGMFSLIDAILDRPMVGALAGIPLPADVTAALLGEDSEVAGALGVVVAYERADWVGLEALCASRGIDESTLLPAYLASVEWVSGIFEDEAMDTSA